MAARPAHPLDRGESTCTAKTTPQACERRQRNKKVCLWGLAEPHGRPSRSQAGTCVSAEIYKVAQHVKKHGLDLLRPKCADKTKEQCKRDKGCLFGHVFTPEQAEREDFKRPSKRDRCVPRSLYEQHGASNKNGVPRLWPRAGGGAAPEEAAGAAPAAAAGGAAGVEAAAGAAPAAPRPAAAPAGPPPEWTQSDADRFQRSYDSQLQELQAAVRSHESFQTFIERVQRSGWTWWLYWGPFMAAFLSEEFRDAINTPAPEEEAEKTTQFLADAWKFYIARTRETPELGVHVERFLEVFFPDRLPQLHHVLRAYETAEKAVPAEPAALQKTRDGASAAAPGQEAAAPSGPAAAIFRAGGRRRHRQKTRDGASAAGPDPQATGAEDSVPAGSEGAADGPAASASSGPRRMNPAEASVPAPALAAVRKVTQSLEALSELPWEEAKSSQESKLLVTAALRLSPVQQGLVLTRLEPPQAIFLRRLLEENGAALAPRMMNVLEKQGKLDPANIDSTAAAAGTEVTAASASESESPPASDKKATPLAQFLEASAADGALDMKRFWKTLATFQIRDWKTDFQMQPVNYAFFLGKLLAANYEKEFEQQPSTIQERLKAIKELALRRILGGINPLYLENVFKAMTGLGLKDELKVIKAFSKNAAKKETRRELYAYVKSLAEFRPARPARPAVLR